VNKFCTFGSLLFLLRGGENLKETKMTEVNRGQKTTERELIEEHNKAANTLGVCIKECKFPGTLVLPKDESLPKGTDVHQILKPIVVREEMIQLLTELQVFYCINKLLN
jgi:hypothetical protein